MPQNPPEDMPRITPYLYYNNVSLALSWLEKVFMFERRGEIKAPDGSITHAEMGFADGVVMLGPASEKDGALSPIDVTGVNQGLYVYVDDVDLHFQHARLAGAEIVMEPQDMFWGDRVYKAHDLEGHHWSFATHVKDIALADMQAPS